MTDLPVYRRPAAKWCTQTAIRLIRIGCNDTRLNAEMREAYIKVAASLDLLGQVPGPA